MHYLLCWYCMRLGCLYYVIWTFHVLSLYIMFLSHLLFLCVAVYLSTSRLSSLTISSLFSYTNYVFNNEREKERLKYMSTTYTVKSCLVFFPHTYAHPINTTNCGVRYSTYYVLPNTIVLECKHSLMNAQIHTIFYISLFR